MMPSRGIQLGLRGARASQFQLRYAARNFSSGPSRPLLKLIAHKSSSRGVIQAQRRNISWNVGNWVWGETASSPVTTPLREGTQNASPAPSTATSLSTPYTTSPETVSAATAPPTSSATHGLHNANPGSSPPLDEIISDSIHHVNTEHVPLAPVQEKIGFLHELGIDYGWGPTSIIQWTLEHIHVYTGLPWWASIFMTAAAFKLALLPIVARMSDNQMKMQKAKPIMDPIQKEMSAAMRSGDAQVAIELKDRLNLVKKRSGMSLKWFVYNGAANMILGICGIKLFGALCALPVPGFLDGGFAWFVDLTARDPYRIVPALLGLTIHLNTRIGSPELEQMFQTTPAMRPLFLYALPAITWFSLSFLSVATVLWLTASGVFTILVTRFLNIPAVREWFGIMPLVRPEPGAAPAESPSTALWGSNSKTIDVKGERKFAPADAPKAMDVFGQGAQYQAPSAKRPSSSAVTGASAPAPIAHTKSPGKTRHEKKSESESQAESEVESKESKSYLRRYVSSVEGNINRLGNVYSSAGKSMKSLVTGTKEWLREKGAPIDDEANGGKESKTRSKSFLKQAEEYEKRVQAQKKREGR